MFLIAAPSLASIKDKVAERIISSVSQYLDAFRVSVSDRLITLEAGVCPVVTPPQFSDVLKGELDKRAEENKDKMVGVTRKKRTATDLLVLTRLFGT